MRKEEIQIVRRRMDDYPCYAKLALEADRKALEAQERLETVGQLTSPQWDKIAPCQNHTDWAERLTKLMGDISEYESEAAEYRKRMRAIRNYIQTNYDPDIALIMRMHFVDRMTYEVIEEVMGVSESGLRSRVYRAMEDADFEKAAEIM